MKRWLLALLAALWTGALASPQDPPAQEEEPKPTELIEVEVTVGRRPNNAYNMPGFQTKPPLELQGKAADAAALRAALEKPLEYILSRQGGDGSWRFDPRSQLRAESGLGRRSGFVSTAADSMSPAVLTAICCMALRAHQELAPKRIEAAVAKGLEFVAAQAPEHTKARYGVWTWSFCILFLVQEHARATDPAARERLKAAVQKTAEQLMKNQHGGSPKDEAPKRPAVDRALEEPAGPDPRDQAQRVSKGGFFGVTPADEDEIGKEGALVQRVDVRGPAGRAGLNAGDRIVEIDGVKIEGVDDLYRVVDSLEPDKAVKVKALREAGAAPPAPGQPNRPSSRRGSRPLPEDGGWSYYNTGAMSFATATAALALMDAKALGCEIPQAVIDRAVAFVDSARLTQAGSEDGYAYRAGTTRGPVGNLRGSIGRIAVCELALLRAGKSSQEYLARALGIFAQKRGELDRVRGYPGNHFARSFMNAAYYFWYGHYFSAHALRRLENKDLRAKYGPFIQEATLTLQHPEGTWTDHEAWGQLYGTAMAMMCLGELKAVTPGAYEKPLESVEVREYLPNEY